MHAFRATATLIFVSTLAAPASAQHAATGSADAYPAKYVRIITGGAGNMHDIVARQLGQRLTERWGKAVVVENRPGAGMTIGTSLAARASPDGYTLLLSDRTAIAVAPSAYTSLS